MAQMAYGQSGDDHGDLRATATQLEVGAPLAGTLGSQSDVDVFRLDLIGNAQVVLRASGPTDTAGELLDHEGARIANDRDAGPGANFSITAQLEPGIYYLAVTGDPGDYAVDVRIGGTIDHGNTPETSTRIRLLSARDLAAVSPSALLATTGRIHSGTDVDMFRFLVPRNGMAIAVRTAPAAFNTYGRVLNAAAEEVASVDGDGAFRVATQLDAGIYYVEVRGREAGAYRLLAQGDGGLSAQPKPGADDHGDTPADSTVLEVGPPLPGTLGSDTDIDVFRIDLPGRAELAIRTSGPTDTAGELFASDGIILAGDTDNGPASNFSITAILDPGIYYVAVTGSAGEYAVDARATGVTDHGDTRESATRVRVLSSADLAAVQPSALLATSGRIQDPGDVDVFRIVVPDDDTNVTIRTMPGSFDTSGRLLDPFGNEIAVADAPGALRMTSRLDAGIYYVEIRASKRGGYRLLVAGTVADTDGDGVIDAEDAFPYDATRQAPLHGVSNTADGQIILQLEDGLGPDNLFDLNGQSIVFTPDPAGRYSREAIPLNWEVDIGGAVDDDAKVDFDAFAFRFGGEAHDSFHVSPYGVLTFGAPSPYTRSNYKHHRFAPMAEFAGLFAGGPPAVVAFFKPLYWLAGGEQHVKQLTDRIVVTWTAYTYDFAIFGQRSSQPEEFQAVLFADGRVQLSYRHIANKDGLVGLFPTSGLVKQDRVLTMADPVNPDLPAHIDIRRVDVFETNTEGFIVEFTLRGPLRRVAAGSSDEYALHLDVDVPFWNASSWAWSDADIRWGVSRHPGQTYVSGPGNPRLLTEDRNRIAFTAYPGDFAGGPATAFADAAQFDEGHVWDQVAHLHTNLPVKRFPPVDLSRATGVSLGAPHEVFHWPAPPDIDPIVCRVIDVLGDDFDVISFHSEFRIDFQEAGSGFARRGPPPIGGIGGRGSPPHDCGTGRLLGHFSNPVWMKSRFVYESSPRTRERQFGVGSFHFAHEFGHTWSAFIHFNNDGMPEPLYEVSQPCRCHWRFDLHSPAAFAWDPDEPRPTSVMGGLAWEEGSDGTWTAHDGAIGGGFSWLDLYLMGLADLNEVPDLWLLRNLPADSSHPPYIRGRYTADKEVVSLSQVIAAEGPRDPAYPQSQSRFNAAFVYLPIPGKDPDPDLLELHARHVRNAVERWSRTTGGRSTLTTELAARPHAGDVHRTSHLPARTSTRPTIPAEHLPVPPTVDTHDGCDHPVSAHSSPFKRP